MRRLAARLGSITLLFLGLACSVSDYEQRIDQQRAYLFKFDEEIKVIAPPQAPLMPPPPPRIVEKGKDKKKKKEAVPGLTEQFYLRAPHDIARQHDETPAVFPAASPGQVVLYRYPAVGAKSDAKNPLKKPPESFPAVFVTTARLEDAGGKNNLTAGEFRRRALRALKSAANLGDTMPKDLEREEHWKKEKGHWECDFVAGPLAPIAKNPDQGKPAKDKSKDKMKEKPFAARAWHFFAYHFEQNSTAAAKKAQAMVIYQVPDNKKDDTLVRRTIDMSVSTFGLAEEAVKKRLTPAGRPR